ncbi:MAG: hypothetical protein IPZ46_24620 [Escherichia coli]|nr:hypothetical protein [Escherichia coli]
MKLKKLLALTLTGAVLTASLTACTPLDAAELVYDSIFGGGSSSTGSGNNGSTGGTTGGGSTAEDAENRAVAEAFVRSKQSDSYTGKNYANITPVYDIPYLEEFVQAIDEYCTKKSAKDGRDWEYTVHNLSTQELNDLSTVLKRGTYGSADASLQFGKDIQGTPEQKANSFTRTCGSFWDTKQSTPYKGKAWFDSVVLTRADGSTYRFLLSICHG